MKVSVRRYLFYIYERSVFYNQYINKIYGLWGLFSLEGKKSQFIVIAIMQVISGIRLSCRCATMLNLTINGNTMVSSITQ